MRKLDELLDDYIRDEELTPGISLALLKDGKCIYKKSHGYANLENNIEINSKTAFYLASVSKSFTAAGIMLLHEKGELDLSDKVQNYFTDLPDFCTDIKIMHLVNHTSGLNDYFNICSENGQNLNCITNKDVYNLILEETALNFPIGDKFEYSNTGYILLSLLIEKVSGQSYSDFLRENFFEPLGMKNTYVFTEDKPIIPNRAYGYQQIDDNYFCSDYYVLTTGDGGIYSSIDDLLLWVQAFDNESIFKKDIVERLFSKEKLNDGTPCIYAFGWFTLEKDDKKVVFHSGRLGGFTNMMIKSSTDDFSMLILTNYYRDSWEKLFKTVHELATETNAEIDLINERQLTS